MSGFSQQIYSNRQEKYKINFQQAEKPGRYSPLYSPLPSIQLLDNNLDQVAEESLVFTIGKQCYQKQVQSIMNDADCRGSFSNYIVFRKNLLLKTAYFEICAAQLRESGE